jgi:hypothetical protein
VVPLLAAFGAGWTWHAVPVRWTATPPPLPEYAMPFAATPSLLARLTGRRLHRQRQPEPADMGTAFGMEQWLDERDHGATPAATRPTSTSASTDANASASTSTTAATAKRDWWPRWLHGDGAR